LRISRQLQFLYIGSEIENQNQLFVSVFVHVAHDVFELVAVSSNRVALLRNYGPHERHVCRPEIIPKGSLLAVATRRRRMEDAHAAPALVKYCRFPHGVREFVRTHAELTFARNVPSTVSECPCCNLDLLRWPSTSGFPVVANDLE